MKTKVKFTNNHLGHSLKENMWAIYQDAYNYSRESFMNRIASNNQYALYYHGEELIGFTGLRINRVRTGRKENLLIYFGQTVIRDGFRGKSLIPVTGFKLCLKYWKDFFSGRAYFWADSLTYKAYLVFAKTLDCCFPSYKQPTPAREKQLIDTIGQQYYPDSYLPATGTVRKTTKLVSDQAAEIRPADLRDPDIRFFATANPNNSLGHGLITLGPASWKNLLKLAGRYLRVKLGLKKSPATSKQAAPAYRMEISGRKRTGKRLLA